MVEIYKEKGFEEEDARKILTIMARHKDFFLDHMMVEVTEIPSLSPPASMFAQLYFIIIASKGRRLDTRMILIAGTRTGAC